MRDDLTMVPIATAQWFVFLRVGPVWDDMPAAVFSDRDEARDWAHRCYPGKSKVLSYDDARHHWGAQP